MRRMRLASTVMTLILSLTSAADAGELVRPLESRESWRFADARAWAWDRSDGHTVLRLASPSDFKSEIRRPRNLAWFEGKTFGSFTLRAELRLELFNEGNNDLCIAFAQTSETRFYYAHLGESADGVHLHIHLVDDADRKPITRTRAESLPWHPGRWHKLVMERDLDRGTIRVWFDGVEVLAAEDRTLAAGRIGLGSFDDLGAFRALEIEGTPRSSDHTPNLP